VREVGAEAEDIRVGTRLETGDGGGIGRADVVALRDLLPLEDVRRRALLNGALPDGEHGERCMKSSSTGPGRGQADDSRHLHVGSRTSEFSVTRRQASIVYEHPVPARLM